MGKKDSKDAKDSKPVLPVLILPWDILEEVIQTIGRLPAESGGAIGGNGDGAEISHFHFDESSGHPCPYILALWEKANAE